MKKTVLLSGLFLLSVSIFTICNRKANASNGEKSSEKSAKLLSITKNGITLTEFYSLESFENASIQQSVSGTLDELDNNTIKINYETSNYTLGQQTNMNNIKSCANSAQGQHIHCIVDNQPYNALYKDEAIVNTLKDGQHIVLSFISRSYHESIKNKNAYTITSAITGKSRYTARYAAPDLSSPMLFYSRPKGEYKGDETKAILLDFYLVNCDLSKDGFNVKVEINGTEFILDKWSGYFMEGLPQGENKIKLTLIDKKGKQVDSPYSMSERTFKLSN